MLTAKEKLKSIAAAKSGMDEKTARKYLKSGKLPSQMSKTHHWRTRKDPFGKIWGEATGFLWNPGIEAKTVFEYFQRKDPEKFQNGQLRTFQRRVKIWRALKGPGKEVFFPQIHYPGDLSSSDFTSMNKLGITLNGEPFNHLINHFVLTYSNWETGTICFSESYESLSEGLQNAFWELGGVTKRHRTDNLSAAIYSDLNKKEFTQRYKSFLTYYRLKGEAINAGKASENGDVEQSHNRFKKAVEQALILRGSRNFLTLKDYEQFIRRIFVQLNMGRQERFLNELEYLKRLPNRRLNDFKRVILKVGPSSTVSLSHNVYSVHSRLIGERVEFRLYAGHIEVWYAQRKVDRFPRLRGERRHHIQYRHIIDWLVRKPKAFNNYRYRDDLFPSTNFRMAYDYFNDNNPSKAQREYTKLLYLAAKESEEGVNNALRLLFKTETEITIDAVLDILGESDKKDTMRDVSIDKIKLSDYDTLLSTLKTGAVNHESCYQ